MKNIIEYLTVSLTNEVICDRMNQEGTHHIIHRHDQHKLRERYKAGDCQQSESFNVKDGIDFIGVKPEE